MESVKGCTNIVSIEDYKVIERRGEQTWYILIRMELLTSLTQRHAQRPLIEEDVVRLGRDLCTALAVCRRKSIVHRNIKPENVFVNGNDDFVPGDFGVARNMDKLTGGMTRVGTYNYMAPELFNNSRGRMDIDAAARMDIYSLGMVMYRLLNRGRLPLMNVDAHRHAYTYPHTDADTAPQNRPRPWPARLWSRQCAPPWASPRERSAFFDVQYACVTVTGFTTGDGVTRKTEQKLYCLFR